MSTKFNSLCKRKNISRDYMRKKWSTRLEKSLLPNYWYAFNLKPRCILVSKLRLHSNSRIMAISQWQWYNLKHTCCFFTNKYPYRCWLFSFNYHNNQHKNAMLWAWKRKSSCYESQTIKKKPELRLKDLLIQQVKYYKAIMYKNYRFLDWVAIYWWQWGVISWGACLHHT